MEGTNTGLLRLSFSGLLEGGAAFFIFSNQAGQSIVCHFS